MQLVESRRRVGVTVRPAEEWNVYTRASSAGARLPVTGLPADGTEQVIQ